MRGRAAVKSPVLPPAARCTPCTCRCHPQRCSPLDSMQGGALPKPTTPPHHQPARKAIRPLCGLQAAFAHALQHRSRLKMLRVAHQEDF